MDVTLGHSRQIHYTEEENMRSFCDVQIISLENDSFYINRFVQYKSFCKVKLRVLGFIDVGYHWDPQYFVFVDRWLWLFSPLVLYILEMGLKQIIYSLARFQSVHSLT